MMLQGVIFISLFRYLCNFTLCLSFPFLFFIFIFIFFFYIPHFFFSQVLGESLHLTSEYLALEAKVESTQSCVTTLEAENSKLKKELIVAMNDANLAKEKLRTLIEELRVERELTKEKGE